MQATLKLIALCAFLVLAQTLSAQTAVVVRPPAAPGPTVVAVTAKPAPVTRRQARIARKQSRKAARRATRRTVRRVNRRS